MNEPGKLCLHTMTTKPWPIETAAVKYSKAGIGGISVWREALEGRDPSKVGEMLAGEGLDVVSLVRGGFFAHTDAGKRKRAIADNKRALEEAGLHLVHYYQLLNIAENVEWARQLWTTRYVTLNQPPLWAYFHAGSSLLGGPDLQATYLVFLLVGAYSSIEYAVMYGQRNRSAWAPYMAPIKIIMGTGVLLMLLQAIATFFKDLAKARGKEI